MSAYDIVDKLLGCFRLEEASVHLPRRGTVWVATFRDGSGKQLWRSTRLTDRSAALVLAKKWETGARQDRANNPGLPKRTSLRVRPVCGLKHAGLTQLEVALILRLSERAVREIERRAMEKLRNHPALRQIWREWMKGEIGESGSHLSADPNLTTSEWEALFALTRTPLERLALAKLFRIVCVENPR